MSPRVELALQCLETMELAERNLQRALRLLTREELQEYEEALGKRLLAELTAILGVLEPTTDTPKDP